jgi:hypothetical protein
MASEQKPSGLLSGIAEQAMEQACGAADMYFDAAGAVGASAAAFCA